MDTTKLSFPRLKLAVGIFVAGLVGGMAITYYAGPTIGRTMQHTGARLVSMDGDMPLTTAREVEEIVDALAAERVTAHVRALVGPTALRKAGAR